MDWKRVLVWNRAFAWPGGWTPDSALEPMESERRRVLPRLGPREGAAPSELLEEFRKGFAAGSAELGPAPVPVPRPVRLAAAKEVGAGGRLGAPKELLIAACEVDMYAEPWPVSRAGVRLLCDRFDAAARAA